MSHARNPFRVGSVALLAAMVSIVAAISGCGSRGPQTYPVQLKVSFADGGIPAGAIVAFLSDSQSYSATGKVQADGTCELSTFAQGDGAVVGRHLVTVASAPTFPAAPGPPPTVIHPRFGDKNTSGLEFTVTPEGPNQFSMQVERPSRGAR